MAQHDQGPPLNDARSRRLSDVIGGTRLGRRGSQGASVVFFFFPGLSRHLRSPVSLMILFLHSALFVVLSSFNPASVISLLHAYFHLRFGRPLLLFPGMSTSNILLTMCSSFIVLTWPYHFSHFSVIFLDAWTTLVDPLMCSFQILSLLVTPQSISASPSHSLLVVLLDLSSYCQSYYAVLYVSTYLSFVYWWRFEFARICVMQCYIY